MNQTILIVDDEESIQENLTRILAEEGYRIQSARSVHQGMTMLETDAVDLVLLDLKLPDDSGMALLRRIRDIDNAPLVIVMTGYATVDSAVEALKLGAYDYIKKPFKADAIKLIVRLALETQGLRRKVDALQLEADSGGVYDLIGQSAALTELRKQILQIAASEEATVLITGESGTGKELTARAIHAHSVRKDSPFIDINCASLPSNLLESELFGYEKGAFTDAKARKPGYFEVARGGTLFLDEIAELNTSLQAKLLRVLEQRTVRHLGGTNDIPVNVRVIAATNQNLKSLVEQHAFREDLYYRLNVIPLMLTPLRERPDDIAPLLEHYRRSLNRKLSRSSTGISAEAMSYLLRYSWPGNVRELRNLLERILILYNPETIELAHLPQEILSARKQGTQGVQIALPAEGISLPAFLASVEDELIRIALDRTSNNITQAAKLLNVPRETLRYKLSRTGSG